MSGTLLVIGGFLLFWAGVCVGVWLERRYQAPPPDRGDDEPPLGI